MCMQTPHLHKISNLTKKIVSTSQFTFDYKVLKRYMIPKIVKQGTGFQICKLGILRAYANHALMCLSRFPNLGSDEVIIPGTANLSFNIELSSMADPKRALVSSIGRVIVKKLAVKFEGNEILNVDNFDVFACYQDLWKQSQESKMQ